MTQRLVGVGDHVEPGQVLAKLDPQDELNQLRSAQARLVAAQGRLREAQNNFAREQSLLARKYTTKVLFDQAQTAVQTTQSEVEDAKARLQIAEDQVRYTELKADAAGTIIGRGAEASEVVQAGQMIFRGSPGEEVGRRVRRAGSIAACRSARPEDHCGPDRRPQRDSGWTASGRSIRRPIP